MSAFLQHEGEPVFICGYVAPYDSLSVPLNFHGGKRELFRPQAFDDVVRQPSPSLNVQLHHMGEPGVVGSIFAETLQIWSDPYGLAYECGPFPPTGKNAWAINSIVRGGVRGCSCRREFADVATEIVGGERVVVVRRLKKLCHISPVTKGAYPGAATWCSHECPYDLPDQLKRLAEFWAAHRPRHDTGKALRTMAAGVSKLPSRAVASRAVPHTPVAERHAPIPVAVYNPAPKGLSQEEWEEFGFQEDAGRRAWKEPRARRQARRAA